MLRQGGNVLAVVTSSLSGGTLTTSGLLFAFEVKHDIDKKLAQASAVKCLALEVEGDLHVRLSLLVRFPHTLEEWMLQSLVDANAEVGVELKHAVEEVDALGVRARVSLLHVHSFDRGEALEIADGFGIGNVANVFVFRRTKHIKDNS